MADLSVVYVLTNPAMPGLVKIGMSSQSNTGERLAQLYTTGVPVPFELQFACRVTNPQQVESALHIAFGPQRINPRREFFRIDPEQAIAILRLLHTEDTTAEVAAEPTGIDEISIAAATQLRERRPNLNFQEMGITSGEVLNYIQDPNTTVVIAGPRKVLFQGEELSLTAVTRQLLGVDKNIRPTPYWMYNGRSLVDIYEETYEDTD
jgi:hypothetical protein